MKQVISFAFMILLFVYLILIFNRYSENYDKLFEDITHTAVENTASNEVIYVHEDIYEITDIHVDGVHKNVSEIVLSINVVCDGEIVLVNNATGAGDLIELTYSYESHPAEYTSAFIKVIPVIMIIILVTGLGYVIINRR